MRKYTVIQPFADRDNFAKRYQPGETLPGTFSEDRIAHLLEHGLIQSEGQPEKVSDVKEGPNVAVVVKPPKAAPKPKAQK